VGQSKRITTGIGKSLSIWLNPLETEGIVIILMFVAILAVLFYNNRTRRECSITVERQMRELG